MGQQAKEAGPMRKHRDTLSPKKQLELDGRYVRRTISASQRQYEDWLRRQYAAPLSPGSRHEPNGR